METKQMPLDANSRLDLAINKDDLIDILIDSRMTILEEELEINREEAFNILSKITELQNAIKENTDKELLKKYLPPLFRKSKPALPPTLSYYEDSESTYVTFSFSEFKVTLSKPVSTINNSDFVKLKKIKIKEYADIEKKLYDRKIELQSELTALERAPKRVKAQMLRSFLKTTSEGKNILAVIESNQVKVLPPSTKK